ncbi:MAG: hypothetical protein NTY48_05170 [Candidatus Diapherotrites archaeon]|nr:hypothetical protein [Candidatus Diapherotrites archaeon]
MKYELTKIEGQKKAKAYLKLSKQYKKKYNHAKKKNDLISSLVNQGFFYHSKAILAGASYKHKLKYYLRAAETFETLNKTSPSSLFKAYKNEYLGYASVVSAGTSSNNMDKSNKYRTASMHFAKASKLFKKENKIEDSALCKGWNYLTQSCVHDSKAASESELIKRIKLYKNALKEALAANKIFNQLKINKLKKRTKSIEFSSKAWILALKKQEFKKAAILFSKAATQIKGINEWRTLHIFCTGLERLFKGMSTENSFHAKTALLEAEKLFRDVNCIELATYSSNFAKTR